MTLLARSSKLAAACVLALASAGFAATTMPPALPTTRTAFPTLVLDHFKQWDLNHDGSLDEKEIDHAITSADAYGPTAAAMLALRKSLHPRKEESKPPAFNETTFATWDDASAFGKSTDLSYLHYLKQVQSRPIALFPKTDMAAGPNLSCMRQGQVGDCFFIAPTGAYTFRDPSAVEKMIEPLPNKAGYRVTFATGDVVEVPPITDAEYALGANTRGEGVWLPVLEQAYGKLKMASLPTSRQSDLYTESITRGGMSKNVIALYTGHATHAIQLRSTKHSAAPTTRPDDSANDDANKPVDLYKAERNRADLAMAKPEAVQEFRASLIAAMANRKLVTAGGLARMEDMPPDLSANHVYAIVGYDAQKDLVQAWNPHGQDFKPKGPDGLHYGFTTSHGRFDVPLADFVQVFRSATFETDAAAPKVQPTTKPGDPVNSNAN